MNQNFLDALEYSVILEQASRFCHSAVAQSAMQQLLPCDTEAAAREEIQCTREAFIILFEYVDRPIGSVDSVSQSLQKLEKSGVLEIRQLLAILRLLRSCDRLKEDILKYEDDRITRLPSLACSFGSAPELEEQLDRAILSEEELKDTASRALETARDKIRATQNKIKDKLRRYVTSSDYATALQDRLVTMRDGRYVLPVKSENRSAINGIVHDVSDSGATCFIEPIAIVELNNVLREAEAAEAEEVARILAELSRTVSAYAELLARNEALYIRFDIIFSRAVYAEATKSVCPEIGSDALSFVKGRHPLIAPTQVVPSSVTIRAPKRMLIVSGPNTGGKTVVLKTLGLFCAMSCTGFFIPAESASLPYFTGLFCDIGDKQSISESLSTFSSHIKNIAHILSLADKNSLVLLDELGAGTDPIEGSALAVAIAGELTKKGAYTVITTHYSELKEFGLQNDAVENASMEFDPQTLLPTYRIKMGLPGVSNALEIAETLGISGEILNHARAYIGEGKRTFEKVLAQADIAKTEALKERDALEERNRLMEQELISLEAERKRVSDQYEKLTRSAAVEIEKLTQKYVERAESVLEEMAELQKQADEAGLLKAKQLRTSLKNSDDSVELSDGEPIADPSKLKVGDEVIVRKFGSTAKIKTLPDKQGRLDVSIGNMIVKVKAEELSVRKYVRKVEQPVSKPVVRHTAIAAGNACTEINLLGKTVSEGVMLAEEALDRAMMHGITQVKIIHGVGTGALRKGILQFLKKNRYVAEYRQGAYGEGGYGVTIVLLKS